MFRDGVCHSCGMTMPDMLYVQRLLAAEPTPRRREVAQFYIGRYGMTEGDAEMLAGHLWSVFLENARERVQLNS